MIHVDVWYATFLVLLLATFFGALAELYGNRRGSAAWLFLSALMMASVVGYYSGQVYHPCTVSDWNKMVMKCK